MKIAKSFLAFIFLFGCGAIYISPTVSENDSGSGLKVQVIPITPETTQNANRSVYEPKHLPDVFFRTAGIRGASQSRPIAPDPVGKPENQPQQIITHLPPKPVVGPYTLGVGDGLLLATQNPSSTVEQLTGLLAAENSRQGYTVQDDGAIAIPGIGRIRVVGMTTSQVEEILFTKLLNAGIDPSVSVEVVEFGSKIVVIGGAVAKSAIIPVGLLPVGLYESLQAAGGVNVRDLDYAVVRIFRNGSLYQIPARDVYTDPKLQSLRLIDGDSVFVDATFDPEKARAFFNEQIEIAIFNQSTRNSALKALETEFGLRQAELQERRLIFEKRLEFGSEKRDYVFLSGEVEKQARVVLPFDQRASLADVLYGESGFPTRTGNPSQVYVLRGSEIPSEYAILKAYQLDMSNAANLLLATRFEMRPNDIVFVAEQPVTKWNRAISQITPNEFTSIVGVASQY